MQNQTTQTWSTRISFRASTSWCRYLWCPPRMEAIKMPLVPPSVILSSFSVSICNFLRFNFYIFPSVIFLSVYSYILSSFLLPSVSSFVSSTLSSGFIFISLSLTFFNHVSLPLLVLLSYCWICIAVMNLWHDTMCLVRTAAAWITLVNLVLMTLI